MRVTRGGGVGVIKPRQAVTKKHMGCPGAEALVPYPRREVARAGHIVLCVLARCHDFHLVPLRPPGRTDLGPERESTCISTDQHLMGLPLCGMPPHPGQALPPLRLLLCSHQLGPLPYPADLVEPAAHGCCGYRDAMVGLERHRERGPAPPRAAPALGTWGFVQPGAQRARQPGHQDGRLHSQGELTVGLHTYPQAPGAIRAYDTVPTGA